MRERVRDVLFSQALERCGLLGAVVGGDMLEERVRSATETAKRPVDGMRCYEV